MGKSSKGAALLIVLTFLILLALIGSAVLILAYNHQCITEYLIDYKKAFYLTEAGIGRAVYRIKTEDDPDDETFTFESTNVDITIADTSDNLNFDVTATTDSATSPGNVVREIDVRITRDQPPPGATITISNWEEKT